MKSFFLILFLFIFLNIVFQSQCMMTCIEGQKKSFNDQFRTEGTEKCFLAQQAFEQNSMSGKVDFIWFLMEENPGSVAEKFSEVLPTGVVGFAARFFARSIESELLKRRAFFCDLFQEVADEEQKKEALDKKTINIDCRNIATLIKAISDQQDREAVAQRSAQHSAETILKCMQKNQQAVNEKICQQMGRLLTRPVGIILALMCEKPEEWKNFATELSIKKFCS